MPVTGTAPRPEPFVGVRGRLGAEGGSIMIVVLGVLVVTMLVSAAIFGLVQSDVTLTRSDLDGKRAYAAAQAGVQAYLYQLNANSESSAWWESCANDSGSGTLPGTTGATYSYRPVPANGSTACSAADPVATLIDTSTGTLRIESTGTSGTTTRTIVASLRTLSPLSFLWYTVYETVDTSIGGSGCDHFYYASSPPPGRCDIYWVSGDKMNGPMYTQDQFLIDPGQPDPQFGRNAQDVIASQAPTSAADDICAGRSCHGDPNIRGTREPDVTPEVPLPTSNAGLATDASAHGKVYSGTVTLTVNGTTASGWDCPSASTASCTPISHLNLVQLPIVYAQNASSGCNAAYAPAKVSYATISPASGQSAYYGACGDIYVQGTYTVPLTLAAADDVVVTGDLQTTEDASGNPTGTATLGLVANQYVRVAHTCSADPPVTIDAAILTLQHSFFVDNYGCGPRTGSSLTVHGAIAQYFRGIVGTVGTPGTGYLKNYWYDDRLALILPPYLFDLQSTEWKVFRETLCSPTAASSPTSCRNYAGT